MRVEERAAEEILEEAKQRRQQPEDDMWTELEQYIASEGSEKRRSGCMNARSWQMVHSSSTTAENLENDFDEIAATILEMGWGDGSKKTRFWLQEEDEESS